MKECRNIEFKVDVTNTFLKTVCAYANYDGGQIVFGISDDGSIVGLDNPTKCCLDIENKINDSVHPQPDFELNINEPGKTVILTVKSGPNKPYTYKSKAYRRNDTATVPVDDFELMRLVLQGKNMSYEELAADNQELSFNFLEAKLKQKIGIQVLNKDILKTLNLYSEDNGYRRAAELLSDENNYPGIDVARFGDSINIILKRETFEHESILLELKKTIDIYRDYYQLEEVSGTNRVHIELIPEEAFRETLANALIHRTWDANPHIRVLMFDDRIEIMSPGGLPPGLSEPEYLKGNVSILRNPILGNVFYRLHIVEILGTGIIRIKESYKNSIKQPVFEVSENSIKVTLPVTNISDLSEDENEVYSILKRHMPMSISEIEKNVSFGKSKTTELLKKLEAKNYISISGNGRGTKYKRN